MKKRHVMLIIASVLFIGIAVLCFNAVYNFFLVRDYLGDEPTMSAEPLQALNLYQEYVAHYNAGNVAYSEGNFKEAIDSFRKALTLDHPEEKDCDIRVNLVLASINQYEGMLGKKNFPADEFRQTLLEGRDILLADGCATDNNDGHDKDAQQLKNDIDKLLEMMNQSGGGGSDDGSSGGGSDDGQSGNDGQDNSDVEDDLEEKLKDFEQESANERENSGQNDENEKNGYGNGGDIW